MTAEQIKAGAVLLLVLIGLPWIATAIGNYLWPTP